MWGSAENVKWTWKWKREKQKKVVDERSRNGIYCWRPLDEEECCFRSCKWDKVDRFHFEGQNHLAKIVRGVSFLGYYIFVGVFSILFSSYLPSLFSNEFLVLKLAVKASRVRLKNYVRYASNKRSESIYIYIYDVV